MKKTNLTVSIESEKLEALQFYISKKDIELQAELADTVQKLYEKYVPLATREYVEDRLAREQAQTKPKKEVGKPISKPDEKPTESHSQMNGGS